MFEFDKQNRFKKNSKHSEEKGPKNFLDLWIILWKMRRVLTRFCKLIWTNMYYEPLWNHVVIQQGVFNRLKITYYIASSMNNWKFMKYLILAIRNFQKKYTNSLANCQNASQIVNYERLIWTLQKVSTYFWLSQETTFDLFILFSTLFYQKFKTWFWFSHKFHSFYKQLGQL